MCFNKFILCSIAVVFFTGVTAGMKGTGAGAPAQSTPMEASGSHAVSPREKRSTEQQVGKNETNDASHRIELLETRKTDLISRITRLEGRQVEAQGALVKLSEELAKDQPAAAQRLVSLYKYKYMGYALLLISVAENRSVSDAIRVAIRVYEEDYSLFSRVRRNLDETRRLEGIAPQLEKELSELRNKLARINGEISSLDTQRRENPPRSSQGERLSNPPDGAVAEGHQEPGSPTRADAASGQGEGLKPFSERRGFLPMPTDGEIIITYGGRTHGHSHGILYNRGIIIRASKGQPIAAVHDGSVVFADWLKEYGNLIIVSHGDHYYTLIAHLDEVFKKVGDRVEAGEVIAKVGNTGLAERPGLYFEIRHHGTPLDPMEWLAVHKSSRE